MGNVIASFTMSLDGFIAAPGHDVERLFKWYISGDTDFPVAGVDRPFRISRASADLLREEWGKIGAIVTGRGDFDASKAWGGTPPLGVPMFIVTHHPPQAWLKPDSPFTFVTDGVESAIAQAQQIAGDKVVGVGGTQIVQQALRAGLVDEIQIELAPLLLGDGIRLFGHLDQPVDLECIRVVEGTGVTHLAFRVVK